MEKKKISQKISKYSKKKFKFQMSFSMTGFCDKNLLKSFFYFFNNLGYECYLGMVATKKVAWRVRLIKKFYFYSVTKHAPSLDPIIKKY